MTSAAARPFIGFGNPLLTGRDGTDKRAWSMQTCPKEKPKPDPAGFERWPEPENIANLFRDGIADVAALRRQPPLPETATELCEISRKLGAANENVYLGSRATETEIKKLNSNGTLLTHALFNLLPMV